MMTFLCSVSSELVVATVLFVVMLPLMIIGGVLRILTWPFRLLVRAVGLLSYRGYRRTGMARRGAAPRWRRRGAFARW